VSNSTGISPKGSWSIPIVWNNLHTSAVTKTLRRSIAPALPTERGQTSNGPFRYGWFAPMFANLWEPPPQVAHARLQDYARRAGHDPP